jgi:hypothetical protein
MRALTLCLGAVVAALAVVTPAAAKAPLCDSRPGETIAASSVGRVFRDASSGVDPVLRGCRHGSRATMRLGVDGDCDGAGSIGTVVIAARYVALTRISCDTVSGRATVVLFDLKNGRDLLGASAFTGDVPSGDLMSISVSELVLSPTGGLAWVGQFKGSGVNRSELHLRRPYGDAPELIDSSEALDISDVAISTSKLYWLKAGAPFSSGL